MPERKRVSMFFLALAVRGYGRNQARSPSVNDASGVKFMTHGLRRRTFLPIGESLDVPHYTLKRLANHKFSGDVTGGYIQLTVDRLREPMQRITDAILEYAEIEK